MPTFYYENGLLLVEAHLIDFDGDLYGEHARVQVIQRLREEVRFSVVDALSAQLRSDVLPARSVLSCPFSTFPLAFPFVFPSFCATLFLFFYFSVFSFSFITFFFFF